MSLQELWLFSEQASLSSPLTPTAEDSCDLPSLYMPNAWSWHLFTSVLKNLMMSTEKSLVFVPKSSMSDVLVTIINAFYLNIQYTIEI